MASVIRAGRTRTSRSRRVVRRPWSTISGTVDTTANGVDVRGPRRIVDDRQRRRAAAHPNTPPKHADPDDAPATLDFRRPRPHHHRQAPCAAGLTLAAFRPPRLRNRRRRHQTFLSQLQDATARALRRPPPLKDKFVLEKTLQGQPPPKTSFGGASEETRSGSCPGVGVARSPTVRSAPVAIGPDATRPVSGSRATRSPGHPLREPVVACSVLREAV